jgi:type I restriction enzyme S subunit
MTKPEKYIPPLRFLEFENEWNAKKLGKLFKINAGGDIDKKHVSPEKTEKFRYPIYANAEKDNGFYAYSNIYKANEGTITIAGRGVNIGIAHARDHKYYPIVRLLVLIPMNNENIYFFEYAINRINIFVESTGVPQLTSPQISNYKIFLPTLPEQQKIADFLSAVDKKIEQLTRKKELLEQYKKGVMQKIFSQEIRFKKDDGSDYPDWEEKRLGDILTFIPTNSLSRNDLNYNNGKIKNIHYGDIHTRFKMRFYASKEKVPFINEEALLGENIENQLCKAGDIVFADASEDFNDVGKSIEIRDTGNQNIVAGLHTILARDLDSHTIIGFKGYLLQAWHVRWQIMKCAQGISVLGISKRNLSKINFLLPCKKEQKDIVRFLDCIYNSLEFTYQQIQQTKNFKKGLLQQMFV